MMWHSVRLAVLLTVSSCGVILAADPNQTAFTDPKQAGPEYALQGEYLGTIQAGDREMTIGSQVIALGNGRFRGVGFIGGLPGDGWKRGDETHAHEGDLKDGQIVFTADEVRSIVADGKITIRSGDVTLGVLEKVHRKSPTLGKKPPEGALVLFDGSSIEHFEDGKLVEGKWLGATNVFSKEKFGDHSLHLEFRTPFMPTANGQGRGNSGMYLQSRYEVQILDSFGLEGRDNECGGIYSIQQPAVNMCLPPLAWQTYDVDFTAARYDDAGKKIQNARATVRHNGVVIHDDLELTHGTPGRHPEGPQPEALFLQDHGNPVVFRNIWVVKK